MNTLHQLIDADIIATHSVVQCVSKNEPSLFISLLLTQLKKSHQVSIIYLTDMGDLEFKSMITMPFLSIRVLYWIADLEMLDVKRQQYIIALLKSYQGPHCLGFWASELFISQAFLIQLPEFCDNTLYDSYFKLFYHEQSVNNRNFSKKIFSRIANITLNQACLLMQYHVVIGPSHDSFIDEWFEHIIIPEHSLFSLSGYFFSRKSKDFFQLWHLVAKNYSPVFWTTFWSEQLYRAHGYSLFMEQNNSIDAKKIAFRLPFSFVQKDYKNIESGALIQAHDEIYALDCALKQGSSMLVENIARIFSKFIIGKRFSKQF